MMEVHVIYVFTHDSIGLGEDGPTHQPIEHLPALRAIPNLVLIRPCDANETVEAWRFAVKHRGGPVALALSRQGVPTLDRSVYGLADGLHRGGYILKEAGNGKPEIIFLASGTEVPIALEASKRLEERGHGVRVVSLPCWWLFDQQPEDYRKKVLPPEVRARVALEAAATLGWERYTGDAGAVIGLDHFGASAPYKTVYEKFGLTADRLAERALAVLAAT
jgi:transketolase